VTALDPSPEQSTLSATFELDGIVVIFPDHHYLYRGQGQVNRASKFGVSRLWSDGGGGGSGGGGGNSVPDRPSR